MDTFVAMTMLGRGLRTSEKDPPDLLSFATSSAEKACSFHWKAVHPWRNMRSRNLKSNVKLPEVAYLWHASGSSSICPTIKLTAVVLTLITQS